MATAKKLEFSDLEPVGPGTPTGRYLRRFWQPVLRLRDLPVGQAKPIEVLGEKFTVYRGESGAPHVVAFRCAHRGTQMSLGWVEGEDLRCRYHGWRYDASGQCVEQPNESQPFCEKVKIAKYPTQEYLGLVFAYFGDGNPPDFPRYPDLDLPGVIVTDPVEVLPCTFWNRLDNDTSHIAWVHRATARRKGRNDLLVLRREEVKETEYGWMATRVSSDIGEVSPESPRSTNFFMPHAHFFMPNVFQFRARARAKGFEGRNLWDTKITWTVPLNDRAFAAFDVTRTPLKGAEGREYAEARYKQQEAEAESRWDLAEKVLAGEMTLEDLPEDMGAYTSFAIEDYTTQVGQGPVSERAKDLLAPTDAKIVLLHRIWLREVSALVNGRELTPWAIPKEPLQENVPAM